MDTDGPSGVWRSAASTIRHLQDWLKTTVIDRTERDRIFERVKSISELAEAMTRAATGNSPRIVDELSGLDKNSVQYRHALTLMLLQFEAAKATRGHSHSIQRILPMAEQILRVWALWELGLNYYSTPPEHEETWMRAEDAWRSDHDSALIRSEPGASFRGIVAFAYFAVAALVNRGNPQRRQVPAADFTELNKQLFIFDRRNDAAHALTVFDAKNREKIFELINRWLGCLCVCIPDGPENRESLLSVIEPLPIYRGGRLIWHNIYMALRCQESAR